MNELFRKLSQAISHLMGTPWAFMVAMLVIVVWAVTGPVFGFSATWQLIINTGTTIVTFLMVFLIQNTQNRDSRAVHLKLDELIRVMKKANNKLIDVEQMPDEVLEEMSAEFHKLAEEGELGD